MFRYSINLIWSDEDESYVATIPEFPGLSAFGDTPEEAVEEAKIAANGFIKVYEEDGRTPPEPGVLKSFSGQLRVRIPKSLHASLALEANKECISLNTYIVNLLSEKHAFEKVRNELESIKPRVSEVLSSEVFPHSNVQYYDGRLYTWLKRGNKTRLIAPGEIQ